MPYATAYSAQQTYINYQVSSCLCISKTLSWVQVHRRFSRPTCR